MGPEERELMEQLCRQIVIEKDPNKFTELVCELNELLEQKQHRLKPGQKEKPS